MAANDLGALASALADSLPGWRVEVSRSSPWRRLVRVSVAGGRGAGGLNVMAPGAAPLEVLLPQAAIPSHAPLVVSIGTAIDVRRYLGPPADHVRRMSFDHSSHGLAGRTSAGEAGHLFDTFHLNADYLAPSNDERFGDVRRLAGVVAHEIWHVVEAGLEARDYSATVALRRALGEHLGVPTLEQATRSWAPGISSSVSQAAVARLAANVSDYATTNHKEATAEMFKQWWTLAEPSPTVTYFGSLLPDFLGVTPGPPPGRVT